MAESAKQHIDRIRKTKFSIGGDANPLTEDLHQAVKNLSAELYAKDVHFLMELIQNAEDNEYPVGVDPSLEFVITSEDITATGAPATLLIFNNERGFSEKNIESICSVGRSTKKGNRKRGYIGEKGIGFKSVFLITSQPYIFSNGYQIRFDEAPCSHCSLGYIVPEWVEQHPSLVDIQRMYGSGSALPTTTIILPLKSDKVKPVKEQLSNVHPEVLLFLSKIKRLSIREHCQDPKLSTVNSIGIVSETNFVTRKSIDAESYTIHLSASEKRRNSEQECSYYMWRQKFPVKHENRVERRSEVEDWVITLAFPFGERLGRGNSSPGIYAFLPTEMVTNFPFIIQADFILASSRETILLDDIWNQGILSCVPIAFVNAFTSMVKKNDAPVSSVLPAFRFLPVKESNYAKLNVVRESIKARVCAEEIVPSISHLGQKYFHRPCEVGRLIPTFWDILEKARSEGASLQNISSHGIYILDSAFDRKEFNSVLDFLGLQQVSNEWYVKCIQGCDLVTSVSEGTYVEVLLFIAENWQSRFQSTNMVKVPLIKYVVQKGVTSLSSLADFSPRTLCVSTDKNQAWLLDWNDEFRCMYNFVFMPQTTRTTFKACSNKETILNWLKENVAVANLSVSDYAKRLRENLKGDKRLVVAYAHFIHHSISKNVLSEEEAAKCCKEMPLVDNYGNVNTSRNGVLVPASAGKWVSLVGSNPWRQNGYIELSEEYLSSDRFAGLRSNRRDLLEFLKSFAKAGDIPDIEPPNAAIPALSGALKKENVLLLLEWIKYHRRSLRPNFLHSVKRGSWLRTTMNGFSDYRPPSQSFYHTSSWGSILQNGSILVDIPLVDRSYYGKEIENYKDELKTAGVMFEFSEACTFVGDHLMSLAESSTLSSANVFSILKFIRYLREKCLSPADFITAVKDGPWLKTTSGYRSPDGAVLFSQDWKAASLISDIPFIDRDFYGEVSLNGFKGELELLGVVTQYAGNHSLIVSHLNTAKLTYLTSDAMLLVLDCMRQLSPHKLINALRNSQCFKTKRSGYKSPADCFIPDPEWSCLLSVFDCFPLIDENFYGSKIFSYKQELKQIGVKLQIEDAVKEFVRTFKQKATSSGLTRCTASSLLSCYRQLMGCSHKFPEELMKSFKELTWLHTKLGDFRAPKDCILFDSDWEPLRLIANLPFIDDSSNWYGKSIHDYKEELKSLGVTVELRQGMNHVVSSLSLPDPSSRITPSSALSLCKCIKFLLEDRFQQLPKEFLEKVSVKWLKTHAGYRSPDECLMFDDGWKLEPCDGPFIDEEYYGSEIKTFRKELIEIGVGHESTKACELLASHIYTHSETDPISRIYRFLSEEWKPEKGVSSGRIWIPGDEKWADVSSCVLHDKDQLFQSKLNVLENYYESDKDQERDQLFGFFSSVFGVKTNPSIEDYCALWKDWESTKNSLSYDECCAFWRFVVRHSDKVKAQKLKTTSGYRSPDGAVLFSQDWKAASLISDIPFIDRDFYGEVSLNGFKGELELLGVVTQYAGNHSLIVSHLNTAKLTYLTSDAMLLVLDCMRQLSPHKLINALRNSQCFKTKRSGYKSPADCFIPDPEWSCLLSVFDCFPLIDENFYGSKIFSYKQELKQIGVKLQIEDAVKEFVRTFKQKATSSGLTRCTASSLLSCYRQLMGCSHKFPEELMKSFKELTWLHTKLGDFRAPKDCILFDSDWEPLRLIANLPFIDDSSNWYGKSIHDYKEELKSLGVTVELRQGMNHVVSSLSLPDPSSRITPSSALSLCKCIKFLLEDRFQQLPKEFLEKVSVKWLKTHAGYRSPDECLMFDDGWKLEPCDGPFIDEEYYGSEIKTFRKELIEIGVGHESTKACELLASHIYTHSETDPISRIYRFLSEEWKPEKGVSSGRIWIPGDEKWADVSSCVLHDKDQLFQSKLNVLENYYESDKDQERDQLFGFFSSVFGVKTNPSIEDYCALWKDWESTKNSLSYDECCAFWRFVVRHSDKVKAQKLLSDSVSRLPVYAPGCNNDDGILLTKISDVFIADDLLLKDLFIDSPVFVWYPSPSIPTLSRTKLVELYRKIGVKEISKCVEIAEADITGVEQQEVVDPKNNLIGPGLVKLILGFLSDPSLKIEAEERSRIIKSLVNLDVKETSETITTEYTLDLPSKGEKLIAKAKRMIRWEREEGVVYAEKLEKDCGKRKVLECATCFAEVIAKGVMWEREDLIGRLSELVKMAYLVEFDEDALEFLMKSKNLQVYEEDEKLISDEFSLK